MLLFFQYDKALSDPFPISNARAGICSMFASHSRRRLRWLEHVCRMHDGIIYGELATGIKSTRRPALRYRMSARGILRHATLTLQISKHYYPTALAQTATTATTILPATDQTCSKFDRGCSSRMVFFSQTGASAPQLSKLSGADSIILRQKDAKLTKT